ncbi:chaperonin 10-like protein [Microdochium bolleyi]|uniref:Chaperonin 10-like protein n=1 Tax=Microdochium bolleyi TaxID=196109 RepID=A0A136IXU3_9PEZI|nr:chaperonin 10-like protein [Microdochium bolleyi]
MPSSQPIRKVVFTGAGDVSNISVIDSTISPPAAGEVQVRPLYSGFSGSDINMRRGLYPMQKKAPFTPGYCLAGTVVSLGPKCTSSLTPGQLVACLTVYDSQAQLVNLPEKYLVPVPASPTGKFLVDPRSATAVMLDWTTAQGLVESANVRAGQRVFVHGMSGAVGWAVFMLSLKRGATVYGTASASKHDLIRAHGGHPFVYTDKSWMTAMKDLGGAHVVFDALGFESFDESYDILHRGSCGPLPSLSRDATGLTSGGLLSMAAAPRSQLPGVLRLLARNAKVWDSRATSFYYISRDDKTFVPTVEKLFGMIAKGEIEIPIRQVWDMEEIRSAHSAWGKGDGVGSMLIKINDE